MTNETKKARIIQAINETAELLEKAKKRYASSVAALKLEIIENIELGNNKSANRAWVDYCNEDKAKVKSLQAHMNKLQNMLNAIG